MSHLNPKIVNSKIIEDAGHVFLADERLPLLIEDWISGRIEPHEFLKRAQHLKLSALTLAMTEETLNGAHYKLGTLERDAIDRFRTAHQDPIDEDNWEHG